MRTRIVITVLVVALFGVANHLLQLFYSPLSAVTTANSLRESVNDYAIAKMVRDGDFQMIGWISLICILLIVWLTPIMNLFRRKRATVAAVALALFGGLFTSCVGPYKTLDVVEIKSNETAWVIPLDALSEGGQVKFNSVDFLNKQKVARKRIMVDKVARSTGRLWMDYEWIPSVRVIRVDRSLITAQWTDGKNDKHDDDFGIGVVTNDSVGLRVGLTLTCNIEEDDASTYLYYHGDRPLAEVMGQNIRSYAIAELTREYSKLNLAQAQTKGDEIYRQLFEKAKIEFKTKGVTVQFLGNAEGLTYSDPNVQQAINRTYLAQQDVKTAHEEQSAQKTRNETQILNAKASADSAKMLLDAKEAATFQNELQIKLITAQAMSRWNGALPASVIPANNPLFMSLTGEKK